MGSWRKSSHSMSNGQCIEASSWRKSRLSVNNGACVEAGHGLGVVGVRDSTLGISSEVLEFSTCAWRTFINGVKAL